MATHNDIGQWGENIAREYIASKGYAIVETNARIGKKEIDIVAMHHSRIVFIEVKTRTNSDFDPLDAIDTKKIRNLTRAAEAYVRSRNIPHEVQFDIIIVSGTPHSDHTVTHYPDAFMAPSPPTDPSPPSPSPSPSPHQGAAARAMAGLTKVAWSPTIPAFLHRQG